MDYTKEQVDQVLSQVEQELEKTLGSMAKSEEIEAEEVEIEESEAEEMEKSEAEESEEVEEEYTIDELYASMTKSEKEEHYNAVKKALFGEMEKAEDEEEEEEDKKKKHKKEMEKCGEMSSYKKSEEESEEVEEMKKSETEIKLETENEELKKSLDQVNSLLEKLFNKGKKAPEGKAITGLNVIKKSEENEELDKEEAIASMSKSEITSKLKSLDYGELNKSDREAINNFYLKNGSVDTIKHLIKE